MILAVVVATGERAADDAAIAAADADGDGCSNAEEWGTDPDLGGQRDPQNPNDFFDTNGDLFVDLNDILDVIDGFGGNDPNLDRASASPPKGPDGIVDLNDILNVIGQFGDNCTAP